MGFHDPVIAPNPCGGNSQALELGVHEDPGGRAHPAIQNGDIFPSQIGPALDIFRVALLYIEALGAVADIDQHRRDPGHETADKGGIVVNAVEEVAGRHLNVVLIQREQSLEAV